MSQTSKDGNEPKLQQQQQQQGTSSGGGGGPTIISSKVDLSTVNRGIWLVKVRTLNYELDYFFISL
jgi:hypothetical protein